jgi:hypothetical protein
MKAGFSEGQIISWSRVWYQAVTSPREKTYDKLVSDPKAGLRRAVIWLLLTAAIAYLIGIFTRLVFAQLRLVAVPDFFTRLDPATETAAIWLLLCCFPFAAMLWLAGQLTYAGVAQFIAGALGGTGTFSKLAYANAMYTAPLTLLLGPLLLVPLLNICLGVPLLFYSIVLNFHAIKSVNRFGWGSAILTSLIMVLLIAPIFLVLSLGEASPLVSAIISELISP